MDNMSNVFNAIDDMTLITTEVCNGNINAFLSNKSSHLKILSLNIRSARKNFDSFCIYLQSLSFQYDVLVLTEAWLQEIDGRQFILPGYTTFYSFSRYNKCDGVVLFCKQDISPSFQILPQIIAANCCSLSFSVSNKTYFIQAVYRPPSCNVESFLNSFNGFLETFDFSSTDYFIITGDINIDIASAALPLNRISFEYLDILACYGFASAINSNTRVSSESGTCIDHIFVKCLDYSDCFAAVDTTSISDHYSTHLTIQNFSPLNKPSRNGSGLKHIINYDSLISDLSNEPWTSVFSSSDVNISSENFVNILNNHINSNSQSKRYSNKTKKIKPWISAGLITSIRHRDKLKQKANLNPGNLLLKHEFTSYRTFLNNLIKKTKNNYYKAKIKDCEGDLSKTWKIIKDITNSVGGRSDLTEMTSSTGEKLSASIDISNELNNYYVKNASNLASTIPSCHPPPSQFFPYDDFVICDSLKSLEPTNEVEIQKTISSFKNSTSTGPDGLHSVIYKKCIAQLAKPISHIVNNCFANGIFPSNCKHALVTPLFKGGDKSQPGNWRPISCVTTLSKIIEKCMKTRLMNFLISTGFFSENQFGFLPERGTQDAVMSLTSRVYSSLNKSKLALVLFLDLRKAFDVLSHKILLEKIKKIGIRGLVFDLIKSYLSGRTQSVRITSPEGVTTLSEPEHITHGVPQGTVLGPLLFLIHVNSLCNAKVEGSVFSYADDTAIFIEGESWEMVFKTAEITLKLIKHWLDFNKLSLNLEKTCYMTFSVSSAKQPKNPTFLLHSCDKYKYSYVCDNRNCDSNCYCRNVSNKSCVNCFPIRKVQNYNYLGVTIDENLKWRIHVNNTVKRLRKTIYKIHELRSILSLSLLRQVYYGIVQSIFQYCISIWGGTFASYITDIQKTINCIIKVALKRPRRYPTNLIYSEFNVPNFKQIYLQNILFHGRNLIVNKSPVIITNQNSVNTRRRVANPYVIERVHFDLFKRSPSYLAITYFNKLPSQIKNVIESKTKFKTEIKKFLKTTKNLILFP